MGVHEQHYPPQTMPRITRLLVNIPVRYVVGKVAVYCKYQTLVPKRLLCVAEPNLEQL